RVDPGADGLLEVDLPIDVVLFEEGQQLRGPAPARPHVVVWGAVGIRVAIDVAGREATVDALVGVERQPDLLEVVGALQASRRLADLLDGGQQQADQNADDGDDNEQLDQGERPAGPSLRTRHHVGTPQYYHHALRYAFVIPER